MIWFDSALSRGGSVARVEALATTAHGTDLRLVYELTLEQRGGRWEVRDLSGPLPTDWTISHVGAELELQTGFTLNEQRRPRLHKRPYLRVANVKRARIDLGDVQELEATDDEVRHRTLAVGDLLVVRGTRGSVRDRPLRAC